MRNITQDGKTLIFINFIEFKDGEYKNQTRNYSGNEEGAKAFLENELPYRNIIENSISVKTIKNYKIVEGKENGIL